MTELVNHPEFGTIRTAVIKGEPWFVAKDVCEVLDLNNSSQAISRLDDDEKGVISSDTPSMASIAWHQDEVMRASGDVDVFSKLRDPGERGDIIGFQMRFAALSIRKKYSGAVYSA